MKIFVLARRLREDSEPLEGHRVAIRLKELFAGLFEDLPDAKLIEQNGTVLAVLEIPVANWTPKYDQEDGQRIVHAFDYPLNMRAVLTARGIAFDEANVLIRISEELQRAPESVLRELTPPASLAWFNKQNNDVYFQNDGLGQGQVFEYQDDNLYVLANKISALRAVGVMLKPEPTEWAARLTLGWFPINLSGYSGVRFLAPGTRVRLHRGGIEKSHFDVTSDWVNPPAMSEEDCYETAVDSILDLMREAAALWENPAVGLSGGWDSRAIVALLRSLDIPFSPRVRGSPRRYDVVISSELARIAGFRLRIKTAGGIPAPTPEQVERSIARALHWQGGYMATLKHKTFLVKKRYLDGGTINIMGQHGGFGKADFAVKVKAHELDETQFESQLLAKQLKDMPSFLRKELQDSTQQIILDSYRQADRYDLLGLDRLHFYFLYEYTRRWSSASLASQTGLVFAPYLNPSFIRACYGFPAEKHPSKPFHRYIIKKYAPEWANVPFTDTVSKKDLESGRLQPVEVSARKRREFEENRWHTGRPFKKYDYDLFWSDVGAPAVNRLLAADGFWCELFDPELARAHWDEAPDALLISQQLSATFQDSQSVARPD